MVTRNRFFRALIILFVFYILVVFVSSAQALVTYTVSQEWVHIWINKDGSLDIQYNITLTYTSQAEGIITVGMPKGGFKIESVQDISGNTITHKDVSGGGFYGIEVQLKAPIIPNKPNTIIIYAIIPGMVSGDQINPGNVGMQFYPPTFDGASSPISNVRVAITLPEGVKNDEVRYLTGMPFDDVHMDAEENKLVVYWERSNWPAAQELWVGVSFPEKYVSLGPNIWFYVAIAAGVVSIVVATFVALVLMRSRKAEYEKPRIAVEALSAARGLTAVEAAVVLELNPVRVLTMTLFGLLLKRLVMVTATDPLIKLQKLGSPETDSTPPLRYYEYDYLGAIDDDGNIDEMKLAQTYLEIRDTVDQKLRGYSRTDTVNYYRSVVSKAWDQVTQAGTPDLKGDAVDQNIEWLIADEGFDEKLRVAFPSDTIIIPRPGWWWYWWGPRLPQAPTPTPSTIPVEAKPIPGQDFANGIVLGLEKVASNMVKNVQDFTNRLIPIQTADQRARPVRSKSSCVCACAHCACACACVSCACACAHGGAR